MHGLGHDKARPLNRRLVNLDGRLRRRVPFERWLIKPSSQPVQPAFSSLSGPTARRREKFAIGPALAHRRRVALGLGALGISGGPGSGTLPFLRSAVGTHRANLSAISRAIGTFGIVGDFPTVMPVYHFNLMAGVPRLLDPRGTHLPDDDAARRHADQLVRGQLAPGTPVVNRSDLRDRRGCGYCRATGKKHRGVALRAGVPVPGGSVGSGLLTCRPARNV